MNFFYLTKTYLTMALTLFGLCVQLSAATVNWDGDAGDNNWMTASNWDMDMLPTMTDDVYIDGATVILSASTQVLKINIVGTSDFTINAGVILTVNGFTGNDDGFEINNSVTVTNNGTVNISNINGGTAADGLYIRGTFINNGAIDVTNTGQHGIYVQRGNLTNNMGATISVTNVGLSNGDGDCLYIDDSSGVIGQMTNNGTTTLTSTAGMDDGLYVNDGSMLQNNGTISIAGGGKNGVRVDDATFNNNAGANFNIDGGTDDHLFLDNAGSFVNDGMVTLTNGDSGDASLYVTDNGFFSNTVNGVVNISGSGNYGMQLDGNNETSSPATISNFGSINVNGGSNDGLRIQENGVFNNNTGGVVTFTNSGDEAIELNSSDPGNNNIVNNSGVINIVSAVDHGIEIYEGTFINNMGGTVMADGCGDDGIRMQNAGLFTNNGAIRIDNSGSEDIETETVSSWTNGGTATFAPGSSPGDLEIRDDFDLGGSTTTFEIDGTSATTDFDQILNTVTANTLTISAASKIHLQWGFTPTVGDCFKIIDGSGAIAGTFALSNVTSSDPSINYEINYIPAGSPTEVEIKIVNEPLAVDLIQFTGKKLDRGAQLFWETANEINNAGFDVERSIDGQNWNKIADVRGNGNSSLLVQYNYLDESPASGFNYYRLMQKDYDGSFEYSNTVALDFGNGKVEFNLFPNPVYDVLYIDMSHKSEVIEMHLFDSSGKMLWMTKGAVNQIPFNDYSPGVYFLSIVSTSERTIQKITNN